MAASLIGIIELVWVNMTNSTKPKPMGPNSKNKMQAHKCKTQVIWVKIV